MPRPRAFDPDKALDAAMKVFWKHGYEGASMPELTKRMGINKPSLYAAFGNKLSLFRKALDRYSERYATYITEALDAPTSRDVAERLLAGVIELTTDTRTPRGCLVAQTGLSCSRQTHSVRREMTKRRSRTEARILARLERARDEGDLPADTDPAVLARYLAVMIRGIAVSAADGASSDQLRATAALAIRAWPT